ncbi:hypothetical protein MG293_001837 [Ovis ammon polii]|uniref:Uncharacterized protein n=1 Tax=Ovis ammon polii TaxID=230172 RepID=A0AAD4YJ39_OVIAM|nr:hypothetical protein MG293_001837 [Ovis ammon polii]
MALLSDPRWILPLAGSCQEPAWCKGNTGLQSTVAGTTEFQSKTEHGMSGSSECWAGGPESQGSMTAHTNGANAVTEDEFFESMSTGLSSLSQTANSRWLCFPYTSARVSVLLSPFVHALLPPLCPQSQLLLSHDSPSSPRRQLSYLSDSPLQIKCTEYFQLYFHGFPLHWDPLIRQFVNIPLHICHPGQITLLSVWSDKHSEAPA